MKKNILIAIICLSMIAPVFFASASYTLEMDYPVIAGASPNAGLTEYIRYLYLFGLSIVGLAAFGAMLYGGVNYLLAGANLASQSDAKKWMTGAISGLVLAMASYLIIYTINPALVSISAPTPEKLQAVDPSLSAPNLHYIYRKEGEECDTAQGILCDAGLRCENDGIDLVGSDGHCVYDPKSPANIMTPLQKGDECKQGEYPLCDASKGLSCQEKTLGAPGPDYICK